MTAEYLSDEILRQAALQAEFNRLAQIPQEDEIEHTFSKRFERNMRKLIRQQRRSPVANTAIRFTKRTALVFAVAITLMLATVLSVGAWRAKFFQMLQEVFEKYTEIHFEITDKGANAVSTFEIHEPTYIPDEYVLASSAEQPEFGMVVKKYRNPSGQLIIFYQSTPDAGVVQYNTEHGEIIDIKIGKSEGQYLFADGKDMMIWTDDKYIYEVTTSLGREETLRIAESVKIK